MLPECKLAVSFELVGSSTLHMDTMWEFSSDRCSVTLERLRKYQVARKQILIAIDYGKKPELNVNKSSRRIFRNATRDATRG